MTCSFAVAAIELMQFTAMHPSSLVQCSNGIVGRLGMVKEQGCAATERISGAGGAHLPGWFWRGGGISLDAFTLKSRENWQAQTSVLRCRGDGGSRLHRFSIPVEIEAHVGEPHAADRTVWGGRDRRDKR